MHPASSIDFSASKALCEQYATSFSMAAQFLPEEKRNAAYALYGFCRATDNITDSRKTAPQKKKELAEWKNELHAAWDKGQSGNALLHAFVRVCEQYAIPPSLGFALIEGLEKDLQHVRIANFEALHDYCYAAGAIPGLLMAFALGAEKKSHPYAIALGIGMQLTNILRDIKEDLQLNRIYLPQSELQQFGITEHAIAQGVVTPAFVQFMQFQIARARSYYAEAEQGIGLLPEEARPAIYLCLQYYREILSAIEAKHYDVFSSRIFVSDARKREMAQFHTLYQQA
ncbi:MAG: phytoene/squalene synthase family protein [Candidatus Iainarchaeum archaeon]|uniref:Phytoene/squalene synthase family protein n=1 Tax=Candidatus Iainarchaeum sp. TaxID=3101447 RepID=A0A7T9DKD9_9ARCH|nr:MAG: phytoene/squalene synthase family protein [Candidatus Diapherotrites archaeon]